MKNSWEKKERRHYVRIEKPFIIAYYDKSDPDVKHNVSQLRNISMGGMAIVTAQAYAPETRIAIELKTPFISDMIRIDGVVLESKEKIAGIIFETRLKFESLNPEATLVLKKIVETFLKILEGKTYHG